MNGAVRQRHRLWHVTRLCFAAMVLTACVVYVEPQSLAAALGALPLWALMGSLGFNVVGTIVAPAAISMIALRIERIALPFWSVVALNFATRFYVVILPRPVAIGIRWVRYRRSGSGTDAAALIVFERVVQLFIIAAAALVFLTIERDRLGVGGDYLLAATALATTGTVGLLGIFLSPALASLARRVTNLAAPLVPRRLGPALNRAFDAVTAFRGLSRASVVSIIAVSLTGYVFFVLSAYVLVVAMDLPLDIMAVAWIRSVVFIMTLIPISVGGIGVREVSNVVLLQMYGIDVAHALAFSFGLLGVQLMIGTIGAVLEGIRVVHELRARSK